MASSVPPLVRVGVSAFVLESLREPAQNPRFLVGKRKGSHGAGTYALPSGHLEFGETFEQCVAREVLEETGLKVVNIRFLTATNDIMPKDGRHYVTVFMVCDRDRDPDNNLSDAAIAEPQVLEPDKCEFWEWVAWGDLLEWFEKEKTATTIRGEKDSPGRELFVPLKNLLTQRAGVLPTDV
jgi:8-oxo-dGTP diphosphatase